MKMTYIANACCVYESKSKKLLADPWLVEGAFYGSWFHWPPLKTKPKDLADYDYLYISHLHPDHYCRETLSHFDKSKPVIIYDDEGMNFLEKIMMKEGFTNIVKMKDNAQEKFGPFNVHMFGPFTKHPFHECKIGNILDSAIVVQDSDLAILNANDNTLTLEAANYLKDRFCIYIAQLNYNAAGPYPACFYNLTTKEKKKKSDEILERQLSHLVAVADILRPVFVQPFAGAYVLGGANYKYNEYLGTTTLEEAAQYIDKHAKYSAALPLNEGCSRDNPFIPTTKKALKEYALYLKDKPYSYENREPRMDLETLCGMIITARKRMFRKQKELGYLEDFWFFLKISDEKEMFGMNLKDDLVIREESLQNYEEFLLCKIDRVLLEDILERKAHWNNAEIGCHIDFYRHPDVYRPDFHTFMSFFHA